MTSTKKDWIPFNEWSQDKIDKGLKICTSRHKKYTNDKRVFYITPKLPFWFIKKYLYIDEGAESEDGLQEVFDNIYQREVSSNEEFYVHFGDFK